MGDDRGAVEPEYLLEVEHVRKAFPGVVALDDVCFRLRAGTVHALMGENGAGKSTLMKIIAGLYLPDRGSVSLRGEAVRLDSPARALAHGIAMIHQELNLMPSMTVAENVWIGREPTRAFGLVSHRELNLRTAALLGRLGIAIDPEAQVGDLSVAQRQMVEIARAVSFDADVLIMDEPTSALTGHEVRQLFDIIRDLRERGTGIVYITHKMDEVFEISDEVSVFRDGRYIGTHPSSEVTRDELIRMMVGRELDRMFPKEEVPIGEVVLSVRDLTVEGRLRNVSFDVRAGEILGVAGLVGSGRSDVAATLFGLMRATSGSIVIRGRPVEVTSPREAMRLGMAFITEDRTESGCFLPLDVLANTEVAALTGGFVTAGFVRGRAVARACEGMCAALRIRTPDLHEPVVNLSGGNQQKVLIARWLLTRPSILLLDEPTRGIDVAAKAEIHRLITRLVAEGVAVVMISSELPEVLGMSDRILVMHEGRVTGVLDRAEADQVKVMALASR